MSEKDFKAEQIQKTGDISKSSFADSESNLFYQFPCEVCGGNEFILNDYGVSTESPVLGITEDGQIGCARTTFEGDYEPSLYCRNCDHQISNASSFNDNFEDEALFQWAKSNGQARKTLPFSCSKCESPQLVKTVTGIEFAQEVIAVCEPDSPGDDPLVALRFLRDIGGRGITRYRCSRGHELAKDDGTPVETAGELVEWLKARSAHVKS
jgi:hypothetical protein